MAIKVQINKSFSVKAEGFYTERQSGGTKRSDLVLNIQGGVLAIPGLSLEVPDQVDMLIDTLKAVSAELAK